MTHVLGGRRKSVLLVGKTGSGGGGVEGVAKRGGERRAETGVGEEQRAIPIRAGEFGGDACIFLSISVLPSSVFILDTDISGDEATEVDTRTRIVRGVGENESVGERSVRGGVEGGGVIIGE
jgi:hypothetical protein